LPKIRAKGSDRCICIGCEDPDQPAKFSDLSVSDTFKASEEQPKRAKIDPSDSEAMGDRLLKGWTMLEKVCANCNSPLLQDPDTQATSCLCSPDKGIDKASDAALDRASRSDKVSKLIAQRLLQGYALLQDECPNAACTGVTFC
jgi:uncharacterized Zn finger protein (UPF0148 family)